VDKIDSRKLPEAALNERRRRAVRLRLLGISVRETALQCELSPVTVVAAHTAYRQGGWAAVKVKHGHRPKGTGCLVSPEQEQQVRRLIQDRTPDQLKMSYALWTRQAVSELIAVRFGIRLTVRNTGKYLKRWGFTPQKSLKKAYEQSPQAVGKWLNEEYPAIAKRAKQEGAEIHWSDETGLRSDDVRGRGYAPEGKTPVTHANAARQSLSVISTVAKNGQMRWKEFAGALSAKILIRFLERLTRSNKRKLFLIRNNLRVHHSRLVRIWLEANAEKIEVFYLPSYSPELDPDELPNADLKQHVTSAASARNKIALTRTAVGALNGIQKQPQRVRSYFGQRNVSYAAA